MFIPPASKLASLKTQGILPEYFKVLDLFRKSLFCEDDSDIHEDEDIKICTWFSVETHRYSSKLLTEQKAIEFVQDFAITKAFHALAEELKEHGYTVKICYHSDYDYVPYIDADHRLWIRLEYSF